MAKDSELHQEEEVKSGTRIRVLLAYDQVIICSCLEHEAFTADTPFLRKTGGVCTRTAYLLRVSWIHTTVIFTILKYAITICLTGLVPLQFRKSLKYATIYA